MTTRRAPKQRTPAQRRRRLAIAGLALAPVLALIVAALAVIWMVSTERGARFVLERVGEVMPGSLELGRVEGPIRGPLTLERVVYEREGMRLEIDRLDLRWRPRALLRRQLDVEQLDASGVRLTTKASTEPERPFELPQIDLPVNLAVRQANLRGATITIGRNETGGSESDRAGEPSGDAASAPEPIRIRSAALETISRGDALVIQRFDLDSPDLALEVSGSFTPLGAYPIDLDVAWTLNAPDGRRFRGAGSLDGTLEDLVVRQRLAEPFAAVVEARLLDPLDDLRFDGGVEASGLSLRELDPAWPAMVVTADLAASGSIGDLQAKGQVRVVSDEYGTVNADVAVRGGGGSWRIDRLDLRSDRGGTKVSATGTIALDDGQGARPPRFDVEVGWSDLRWPLDPSVAATLIAPSGSLRARGTPDDYRAEGGLRAVLPAIVTAPPSRAPSAGAPLVVDAQLAIAGDRAGARIERFDGNTLGGRVSATGAVTWTPAIDWRLALSASDVRPGLIEPRLDGSIDLAAKTEGKMTDGGPRGSFVVERVGGHLNGQPLRGVGRVHLLGDRSGGTRFDVRGLRLTWGEAALAAAGTIGDALDLRFTLHAPDLKALLPDAAGSLSLDGTLGGKRASPALRAKVDARSLLIGTMRAKSITGVVLIGPGTNDPLDVTLTATDLGHGGRDFPRARVRAEGTRAEHTLAIAVEGREPPLDRVEIEARGGLVERQWRGTLLRAVYTPIEEQVWTLSKPSAIAVGAPELVRLNDFCLANAGQRVCVTATVRGAEDWEVEAEADSLSLERLSKLYREDLDLRGAVFAKLSAVGGANGAVRGSASIRSSEGTFVVPGESELAGRRAYRDATVRLTAGADGTRAEAAVEMVDVGTVEGFVELPRWNVIGVPPDDQPLRGRFTAHASSLEPVLLVSDIFARPRGRLDVDLGLAGTLGAPRLEGAAHLADASAFVVPLGITIRDAKIDAVPNASGELTITGSLRSGDGVLEVRGKAPLEPKKTLASIELSGEDVLVMDLPDMRIAASTDELSVVWTADGIETFGEVRIPEADVQLGGEESEAIRASSDVVLVRVPAGSARAAGGEDLGLRARVRLIFGDQVHVSGSGLEADLIGSLLVVEEPGHVTRATGELDLGGGSFAAYGARLDIERGRLVFAESPVTSPAVDLRASRKAGEITAGVDASGTLDNPRVVLWSEPPMPQAEQLSYLVLGRPLTDVGAQEGDTLTRAAQSLGLRGGRYLAKRMESMFGLEEARIDTGEGGFEQASLVLGKFLSPRLYMAYGVGLFEQGTNSILVRYLLSKQLTLEASTGESSRADVLYVVETGPGEARPKLEPGLPDRD